MRNTDMMNEYIEHIKNIKRLTADEEFELAVKMRNGDKKARDRFIEANMYLVVYYCKPYVDFGVAYEDLFQEGTLALIKAVDSYDPTFAKINTRPRAAADTSLRTEMSGAPGVWLKVSHTHHEILLNVFETRKSVLFSI